MNVGKIGKSMVLGFGADFGRKRLVIKVNMIYILVNII